MAWPDTSSLTKTQFDADGDNPLMARAQLEVVYNKLVEVIEAINAVNGVCGLDASALIASSRLPVVPITKGGTGATNAADARINLGIVASGNSILMPFLWLEEVQVTADESGQFVWTNNLGVRVNVTQGAVTRTRYLNGSSGNTTITFADKNFSDWNSGTGAVSAAIQFAHNERQKSPSTWQTIAIAPNGKLYGFITTAAGHEQVQGFVKIDLTNATS